MYMTYKFNHTYYTKTPGYRWVGCGGMMDYTRTPGYRGEGGYGPEPAILHPLGYPEKFENYILEVFTKHMTVAYFELF